MRKEAVEAGYKFDPTCRYLSDCKRGIRRELSTPLNHSFFFRISLTGNSDSHVNDGRCTKYIAQHEQLMCPVEALFIINASCPIRTRRGLNTISVTTLRFFQFFHTFHLSSCQLAVTSQCNWTHGHEDCFGWSFKVRSHFGLSNNCCSREVFFHCLSMQRFVSRRSSSSVNLASSSLDHVLAEWP